MPTKKRCSRSTSEGLGENDPDAMVSSEEENMPVPIRVDIEDILGDEWDFGVSAMTADAIRALIAGEKKNLEEA
jgi:hypothetical protein